MQRQESKNPAVVNPFKMLRTEALDSFKAFWAMPLDQVIQEIVDGKENRLPTRLVCGFSSLPEKDKKAFYEKTEQLEKKIDKTAGEWCALGLCLEQQSKFDIDSKQKIFNCFQKADEMGSAEASYKMAEVLKRAGYQILPVVIKFINEKELGVMGVEKKCFNYAAQCLQRAVERGSAIALYQYGVRLGFAGGDKAEVKKHVDAAAEKGEQKALSEYKSYYQYPDQDDPVKDKDAKVKYMCALELQIALGDVSSLGYLANEYLQGKGGYPKDYTHAIYLYRCAAEAQYAGRGFVQQLWHDYLSSKTKGQYQKNVLLYHIAYLLVIENTRAIIEADARFIRRKKSIKSRVTLKFQNLVTNEFELVNRLSDSDPWDKLKNAFDDVEAAEKFYKRKQQNLIAKIIVIMEGKRSAREPVSSDIAIKILKDSGVNPCYLVNIGKLLNEETKVLNPTKKIKLSENKSTDESSSEEKAVCAKLLDLVDCRLVSLKTGIEKRLASAYFEGDAKCAVDYRLNRLTQVFDAKVVDDFTKIDKRIKADKALMNARAELRVIAQLYGLVSEKNPADYFKKLDRFNAKLCQIEVVLLKSSSPMFFSTMLSVELTLFFQQAHDILRPFVAVNLARPVI